MAILLNLLGNEVWLDSQQIEIFTSPNYPSKYGNGNSTEWVFCVSTKWTSTYFKYEFRAVRKETEAHTCHSYSRFAHLQAVNPNDRIMITCSDFEVGLKILRCMDDTFTISTAPSPNV